MDFRNDNFQIGYQFFFYSPTDAQVNCLKNNFSKHE